MAEEKPEQKKEPENNGNGEKIAPATAQNILEGETVREAKIEDEMKKAYIDYAMSVIVSRALPAVEDGLKPVHRRILYAMNQIGLQHNKPTKKSARIVGDTMGKYHPHGDLAIYDALVRMAQPFSLRYPLVKGQGNFGSIDNDPPAASRYTEAKLQPMAEELLQDFDKKTIKMVPNFDNTLQEPELLPGKIPNLLINGAMGIAVGMATAIPPHNLSEVLDGIIACIKKPSITIEELMEYIQGPDFPTAGYMHKEGINEIYKTGRGSIVIRGKTSIEKMKNERERIIISELPYQTNKAELIKTIAKLVYEKKIEDISDIRDESAKDKIRIVVMLKRGANSKLIVNRIYKLTVLETKFHAILLAFVAGQPRVLNLKQVIEYYIKHRQSIVRKRTEYDLNLAEDREHILTGLVIALKNLDPVISLIKKSKGTTEALKNLLEKFKLSQKQAQAILDMKLQKLTVLEQDKLKNEHLELKKKIEEFKKILESEQEILNIIKQELGELKRKYGDARRTKIIERITQVKELDLIKKERVAVMLTSKGYIKRMSLRLYQEQRRGGKGITGTDLTTGDFVQNVFVCSTHDFLIFLTERGLLYMLKAYNLPEATRYSKGKALVNLLSITDKVKSIIPLADIKHGTILIVTKAGIAKRVNLENFIRIKKSGVKASSLPLEDSVLDAKLVGDNDEIIIATKKGIAARFSVNEIRKMGKSAYGVTAIRLGKDDEVIGFRVLSKEQQENKKQSILTITEKGYGKCSAVSDYRKTSRACKGIININCSERNGNVKGISLVTEKDSIIVTTSKGMVIRIPCAGIRIMGRNTQGVRIIRLKPGDSVTDLVKVQ